MGYCGTGSAQYGKDSDGMCRDEYSVPEKDSGIKESHG